MTMSPAARALLDAAREGLSPAPDALLRVRGKVGAATAAGASSALAIKLAIVSVVAVTVGALALTSRGDKVVAPALALSNAHDVAAQNEAQRTFEASPPAHIEMPAQRIEMPAQRLATPALSNVPALSNAATSSATTSTVTASTTTSTPVGSVPVPDTATGTMPMAGQRGDVDERRIDTARRDTARIDTPRTDTPRTDTPRTDTPRIDASRVDEARIEVQPPRAPRGVELAREVELVDAAMAALRRGDATAALASVRMHRAETADRGQLAEDAAAIEIEALCRLRDRRVAAKLEAFDARWPESAQRSRLSTNCP